MAGNAFDGAHVNAQIAADATYMHNNIYLWLKERYQVWVTNAGNGSQLSAISITGNDATQILSLQYDMANLIAMFENGSLSAGRNIVQDCCFLRGAN